MYHNGNTEHTDWNSTVKEATVYIIRSCAAESCTEANALQGQVIYTDKYSCLVKT